VSELGADAGNAEEMQWLSSFVDVLDELDVDWAYWPLNVGPKPGVGADEAYGMLGPSWRPKQHGDVRLALLRTIGLQPPADATSPAESTLAGMPLFHGLRKSPSKESCRSLFGCKDPLLGVLSVPDVKGALSCLAPAPRRRPLKAELLLAGGMRRVQSAQAMFTEEFFVSASCMRSQSEKRFLSWSSLCIRTCADTDLQVGPGM